MYFPGLKSVKLKVPSSVAIIPETTTESFSFSKRTLAKERQFELFKSGRFWDKIEPIDYSRLIENNYYKSWLTFTIGERKWEAKSFKNLYKKNEYLLKLIDDEIKRN